MATLRNKRKLASVTRETQEEHPRNGQSRNTSVPRTNEEYITQVSEEIQGRFTKKLSVPGVQQDRVPHFGCSVQITRVSSEPTDTDALRNRSENIPEHEHGKPGNESGRLPE